MSSFGLGSVTLSCPLSLKHALSFGALRWQAGGAIADALSKNQTVQKVALAGDAGTQGRA
eukprot:5966264-Amphidinium_carterae.1